MPGLKPRNLGHYWKLKITEEIWERETYKITNKMVAARLEWESGNFNENQDKANEVRYLGLDLARLQGKLMKLTHALGVFDGSIKEVPIEIDGGKTDGKG